MLAEKVMLAAADNVRALVSEDNNISMDQPQQTPQPNRQKTVIIAGSIAVVVVGLMVVGVIAYRSMVIDEGITSALDQEQPLEEEEISAPFPAPTESPSAPVPRPTATGLPDLNGLPDTDKDGLNDGEEKVYGTDLMKEDTDGDGFSDYDEVHGGLLADPLDSSKMPQSKVKVSS